MELLWLDDAACHDPSLVGGKTANLSRLAGCCRVPPGFCLPAEAGDVASAAAPAAAIADAYARLSERCNLATPSVAVRSSAVDEDSSGSSFAGLHETYLNVCGADAVADAVARCWASAHSERAIAYRRAMGLAEGGIRVAVLVQQFIPAESAIVAFSANPVSGSGEEMVVEANWGLGEAIVSGATAPDTYTLAKRDLTLHSRLIGQKGRMTVPCPDGTTEVDTPRQLRARPVLDGAQLAEVGALLRDLEQRMGRPVDVEGAYLDGRFYLLQCRPITTLQR